MATETAAWGVDVSQDRLTYHVRFAAVPKSGVSTDELLKKYETLKFAISQSDLDDKFSNIFMEQLQKAKVTIVQSEKRNGKTVKAYLLVEGECTIEPGDLFDL